MPHHVEIDIDGTHYHQTFTLKADEAQTTVSPRASGLVGGGGSVHPTPRLRYCLLRINAINTTQGDSCKTPRDMGVSPMKQARCPCHTANKGLQDVLQVNYERFSTRACFIIAAAYAATAAPLAIPNAGRRD